MKDGIPQLWQPSPPVRQLSAKNIVLNNSREAQEHFCLLSWILSLLARRRLLPHLNEAIHALTAGKFNEYSIPYTAHSNFYKLHRSRKIVCQIKYTSTLLSFDCIAFRDVMETNLFVALVFALIRPATVNM